MSLTSSISTYDIIKTLEVIASLFEEKNIRICAQESCKGAFITGISTLIGGLLGGKAGLFTGGLVGTVAAYAIAPDYKSFLQVIHELDHIKQRKLFDTIQNAVSSLDIIDVAKFAIVLATSQSIKQIVIREAINFISNELHMQITEN